MAKLRGCSALLPLVVLCLPAIAAAQSEDQRPSDEESDDIIVNGRALPQIGVATSASEGSVGYADFDNRPIARVGELAENVPGLLATQHSGSGKANQYFLRGFNLDHGTDLAANVDGVPVNMRSHGHGQGYLDLNFLIPELVERIDYAKGPYRAEAGDFSAAGTLNFRLRDQLERPMVDVSAGSFGFRRALLAGSGDVGGVTLLAAGEVTLSDGPWVLDEALERYNGLLRLSGNDWSLTASAYESRWTSTDQVPERAIESGAIDRFGFVDDDLGGRSSRYAINGRVQFGAVELGAYAVRSRLTLTSNFTYFLDDPVNGDEFRQRDARTIYGGTLRTSGDGHIAGLPLHWRMGADARYDAIGQVGLYRTAGGVILATVREDSVDEYSLGLWGEATLDLSARLRLILGLRGDGLGYHVQSSLPVNSGSGSAGIVTPKASLAWRAVDGVELYASYGEGYHSNDVRGATIAIDPASGDPADRVAVFARGRGGEVGVRVEQRGLVATAALFALDLESELVFVGDAGTTEPNAASRRYGVEASLFWRPLPGVTLDAAVAATHARFRGVAPRQDHIPGAVPRVISAGISVEPVSALTLTMRLRHFGAAPLIEDDSVRSDATTLVNAGAYWQWGRVRLGLDVLNLFDAQDADITYFYASRLPGEGADGVEDRHLHPVEPRQVRLSARISF